MTQRSLLQMLEELASKVRSLEREKKEAALTIQGLEREVGELGALIAMAAQKVDEMLEEGTTGSMSRPRRVNPPVISKTREQPGESSSESQRETKERSSKAFRLD